MTAICVLYVLIGIKLNGSYSLQTVPRRCNDAQRGISAQTRVIRMLGEFMYKNCPPAFASNVKHCAVEECQLVVY